MTLLSYLLTLSASSRYFCAASALLDRLAYLLFFAVTEYPYPGCFRWKNGLLIFSVWVGARMYTVVVVGVICRLAKTRSRTHIHVLNTDKKHAKLMNIDPSVCSLVE
jgi:hypothetical protein